MPRMSKKQRDAAPIIRCSGDGRIFKVAVYARLSDEDIRKKISDSIGTQKSMLIKYIESQPDLRLVEVYVDVNYTGTNFNRPAFTRMIEDIQSGVVDCVVVKDLSRFGRSFEETGNYLERVFPFLGVRFISLGDNYDSLTAQADESSLMVPLKNLMNEVYARDISRKVQAGVRQKQIRGEYCGSIVPYGYTKNGTAFTVDEEAAAVVRHIYEWVLEGLSDVAIVQRLNDSKILPPGRYRYEKGLSAKNEDARFWYKGTVKRIAENPVYIGQMVQHKWKSNFLNGSRTIKTDRDDWVVVEDTHPAIIDADIFEAVQKHRESRRRGAVADGGCGRGTESVNIFKGLIFCGDCKAFMSRTKTNRVASSNEYYFLCNTYAQVDKHACTKKKTLESDLCEAILTRITQEINLAVDMSRLCEKLRNSDLYRARRDALDKRISSIQSKLTANRRFRGSLREDYRDGTISEQDYAHMRADYDMERDKLQKDLDDLFSRQQKQSSTLESKWITAFRKFETEQTANAQMISELVERIEVFDDNRIEVTMRYKDEFKMLGDYISSFEAEMEL